MNQPTYLDHLAGFDIVRLFEDWLESGSWYVVLYHPGCPECERMVPRYVALFAYDTQPGTDSSELLKMIRYGRKEALPAC